MLIDCNTLSVAHFAKNQLKKSALDITINVGKVTIYRSIVVCMGIELVQLKISLYQEYRCMQYRYNQGLTVVYLFFMHSSILL